MCLLKSWGYFHVLLTKFVEMLHEVQQDIFVIEVIVVVVLYWNWHLSPFHLTMINLFGSRSVKKGRPMKRSQNVRKMKSLEKAISKHEKIAEKVTKNENKKSRTQSAKLLYEWAIHFHDCCIIYQAFDALLLLISSISAQSV